MVEVELVSLGGAKSRPSHLSMTFRRAVAFDDELLIAKPRDGCNDVIVTYVKATGRCSSFPLCSEHVQLRCCL